MAELFTEFSSNVRAGSEWTIFLESIDHGSHVGHANLEILKGRSVTKSNVGYALRSLNVADTPRVAVEKEAWNYDDLVSNAFLQKDKTVIEWRREIAQIGPYVERGGGLKFDRNSKAGQLFQEIVALHLEMFLEGPGITSDEFQIHQGQGQLLERGVGAPVKKTAGTSQHFHNWGWRDDPATAKAWGAPILGQAVDDQYRVLVDVANVSGGAHRLGPVIYVAGIVGLRLAVVVVMAIKLIHDECHLMPTSNIDILLEVVALNTLSGWVGWVAEQYGTDATPNGLELELLGGHGGRVHVSMEKHAGGDSLEESQRLFVGGVVGREEANLNLSQDGHDARQTSPATGDDAHVVGGVLTFHPLTVEGVVVRGDLFA